MSSLVCQAVVKGILVEDTILATSTKQAWYKFGKKHGFAMYDFKVIGTKEEYIPSRQVEGQLRFNI